MIYICFFSDEMPKESVPQLEDLFERLDKRLTSYENEFSTEKDYIESELNGLSKKVNELQIQAGKLTEGGNRFDDSKVKELAEKVYCLDNMFREMCVSNSDKFDKINKNLNVQRQNCDKNKKSLASLTDNMIDIEKEINRKLQEFKKKAEGTSDVKDRIDDALNEAENIQEKLYDFETNKKNNLIFSGIPQSNDETPQHLLEMIQVAIR